MVGTDPCKKQVLKFLKSYFFVFQQKEKSLSESVKKLSEKRERKVGTLVMSMNIAFLTCW